MAIKYFYILPKDEHGQPKRFGGTAVGYEAADKNRKELFVTFARCSERDIFDKKKARKICAGRLEKGKFIRVIREEGEDLYTLLTKKAEEHAVACERGRKEHRRGGILCQ